MEQKIRDVLKDVSSFPKFLEGYSCETTRKNFLLDCRDHFAQDTVDEVLNADAQVVLYVHLHLAYRCIAYLLCTGYRIQMIS